MGSRSFPAHLQQPRGLLLQARFHHRHPLWTRGCVSQMQPETSAMGRRHPPNQIRYLRPPGAMNMFTLLVLPDLYSPSLHPRIKGAILLAGPYTFEDIPVDMKDVVRLYHGEVKGTIPLELLNLAKDDAVLSRRWSLGIAERDFPCLTPALEKFKEVLTKKGVLFDEFVAKVITMLVLFLHLKLGKERSGRRVWLIGFVLRLLSSSLGARVRLMREDCIPLYNGHSLILV
ncbi:hypothetical protein EV421DRAFT_486570 [Armillaria borealis]|uniref:Uncharacterized protein n=1 Tax=Armillaria borealis TaxID=47425 RepID=A0AA39JJR8_9AGAR|nr:hypothetical protein EV421DRAFT_486570 [Armillaria borealis]